MLALRDWVTIDSVLWVFWYAVSWKTDLISAKCVQYFLNWQWLLVLSELATLKKTVLYSYLTQFLILLISPPHLFVAFILTFLKVSPCYSHVKLLNICVMHCRLGLQSLEFTIVSYRKGKAWTSFHSQSWEAHNLQYPCQDAASDQMTSPLVHLMMLI